jgi:hypothetical protein
MVSKAPRSPAQLVESLLVIPARPRHSLLRAAGCRVFAPATGLKKELDNAQMAPADSASRGAQRRAPSSWAKRRSTGQMTSTVSALGRVPRHDQRQARAEGTRFRLHHGRSRLWGASTCLAATRPGAYCIKGVYVGRDGVHVDLPIKVGNLRPNRGESFAQLHWRTVLGGAVT